jgi:Ni/Co efflux regulator RcnB
MTMRRAVIAALVLTLAIPMAALADKPEKNKEKGKKHEDETHESHDAGAPVAASRFGVKERDLVRDYFLHTQGRGKCPPGLAKKNNGCLPPGQAKKRYVIGHPLPSTVTIHELPRDLNLRLGPPPAGYRYGLLDGDLVKLAVGSALVVDAISSLVN